MHIALYITAVIISTALTHAHALASQELQQWHPCIFAPHGALMNARLSVP